MVEEIEIAGVVTLSLDWSCWRDLPHRPKGSRPCSEKGPGVYEIRGHLGESKECLLLYIGCSDRKDGLRGRTDNHRSSDPDSNDNLVKKEFWKRVKEPEVRWAVLPDALLAEAALLAKRRVEGPWPEFNCKRRWDVPE
jgi:hypothetical protein